jgi:hypothetical protein
MKKHGDQREDMEFENPGLEISMICLMHDGGRGAAWQPYPRADFLECPGF